MRFLAILLFLSAFFAVSCKKETSWDIDAAIPITKSHLDISNFFGDSIFGTDPNGLLHIAFSKDVLNYKMDDLVRLPDTTLEAGFTLPGAYNSVPGALIYSNSSLSDREITFDVQNSVELNKATVRTGALKIEYFNS